MDQTNIMLDFYGEAYEYRQRVNRKVLLLLPLLPGALALPMLMLLLLLLLLFSLLKVWVDRLKISEDYAKFLFSYGPLMDLHELMQLLDERRAENLQIKI